MRPVYPIQDTDLIGRAKILFLFTHFLYGIPLTLNKLWVVKVYFTQLDFL